MFIPLNTNTYGTFEWYWSIAFHCRVQKLFPAGSWSEKPQTNAVHVSGDLALQIKGEIPAEEEKNGPQQKSSHCQGLRNGVIQPSVLRCPKDCGSWVYVFKTLSVGRMNIHTDSKSEYAVRFLVSACTRIHWRTKNAEDPDPHIFGHTNSMVPEEKHLHLLSMAKLRCLASVKRRWTLFSQGRVWLYDLAWNGKFFIVLCW